MRTTRNVPVLAATLLSLTGSSCSSGGGSTPAPGPNPAPLTWTADLGNPIIESGWTTFGDLLINDPCVVADAGTYRMWYSKGPGIGINHVKIYEATSADGLTWSHDPTVLLAPDNRVAVTGVTVPATAGIYELIGETTSEYTNGKPA